jgi:hypothetical protein
LAEWYYRRDGEINRGRYSRERPGHPPACFRGGDVNLKKNSFVFATVLSLILNFALGLIAAFVYRWADGSRAARFFDALGTPAEIVTNALSPGHDLVTALVDMIVTIALGAIIIWILVISWRAVSRKLKQVAN